jgi:hypothetical protein
MNAITNLITNSRNSVLPTVTIGAIKSSHKEIVLVYLNAEETDSVVLRYDQLSRNDRHIIRTLAQDPLSVLKRMPVQ